MILRAFLRGKKLALPHLTFLFLSAFFLRGEERYSLAEAQKVLKAIEKVRTESLEASQVPARNIIITESELNSYIAYRIETENEELLKELRVRLFKGNKIEGKIMIDLRGRRIPPFIRPQMNFYFAGELQVASGKARINITELFLEGQRIQPLILDMVIQIMAKIENTESAGLSDWYDLPYGLKDIKTKKGCAVFYY